MDPIVLAYGKGQMTAFIADRQGVLDLVCTSTSTNTPLNTVDGSNWMNSGDHFFTNPRCPCSWWHICRMVTSMYIPSEVLTNSHFELTRKLAIQISCLISLNKSAGLTIWLWVREVPLEADSSLTLSFQKTQKFLRNSSEIKTSTSEHTNFTLLDLLWKAAVCTLDGEISVVWLVVMLSTDSSWFCCECNGGCHGKACPWEWDARISSGFICCESIDLYYTVRSCCGIFHQGPNVGQRWESH